MQPRIRKLSVKGFRAYGANVQTLSLPSDIAVIWGANSKGKTSLAEAFEFLLTGEIVRRELMASTQDEFAGALRNAHLADHEDVYVSIHTTTSGGTDHEIKRVLTSDYTKRQNCTTRLEIDGVAAIDDDLMQLGMVLSPPPLQAPILAQHTLSYIFSVGPQDRATYFKTLLDVTDLDVLRNSIAELSDELMLPDNPLLKKFDTCTAIPTLFLELAPFKHTPFDQATLIAGMKSATRALIETTTEDIPETLDDRLGKVDKILTDRRNKTFPVHYFERKRRVDWSQPTSEYWTTLDDYIKECKKVDAETRQLVALFDEALKLPDIAKITDPIDCPLCGEETALTHERVQLIRQHVENVRDFKETERSAMNALTQLTGSTEALLVSVDAAVPKFLKTTRANRHQNGFTVSRLRELLSDRANELVDPWLEAIKPYMRAGRILRASALAFSADIKKQIRNLSPDLSPEELRRAIDNLTTLSTNFNTSVEEYNKKERLLNTALNEIIDNQSDIAGWQDFLDITRKPSELRDILIESQARNTVKKELEIAIRHIDRAKQQVLDDKFAEYSVLIQEWWERLRPDEPTFFSSVRPRKKAKRTIDFKAALSDKVDRSVPKVRDVIAVFSQSQLHCLGLSLFLARAQHENLGFIVLDDPVLSSDEDYRANFNSTVVNSLLKLQIQVIILTQDYRAWKDLETRYRHVGISTAQLFVNTSAEGSIIENTSDIVLAKITRAQSLARGGHPNLRKECGVQLRDAGEGFCKEMLVKNCWENGDTDAALTDYEGKTLDWLCKRVDPLLDQDPSHPGKLEAFKNAVNNACHDNEPPGPATMKHACGEILFLLKKYLNR